MDAEIFGHMPDGQPIHRIALSGGGLTANILTWGAVVQDLRLAGHAAPLVLGFDDFADYPERSPYFGAVAGRFANRIANGRFSIDGTAYQTEKNFLGKHTLHGGAAGIGRRLWRLASSSAESATLTHRAEDSEMGFPGALDVTCIYALRAPGRLVVELTATADAPTLCNLAHHSYFNLDDGGRSDILDHVMQIGAEAYLPVDGELIPTGEVIPVAGTAFDFRTPRPIRRGEPHRPYDHNFCLSAARGALRHAATAQAARSGIAMEVWTTEPGVQLYDGPGISSDLVGLEGIPYGPHSGFCLEAQIWPDAPSFPYFPQALLRPGEKYAQTTEYRFGLGAL